LAKLSTTLPSAVIAAERAGSGVASALTLALLAGAGVVFS
jgi:hypothetical protein